MNNRAVSSTEKHLSLSVHVPVERHHIPLLVGTAYHVWTHVNPPQLIALHVVAINMVVHDFLCRVSSRIARALHNEFHLAVACEVSHRHVIQRIVRRGIVPVPVVCRSHTDGPVGIVGTVDVFPPLHWGALLLLHTAHHGSHLIHAVGIATGVRIIAGSQSALQQRPVAIEIVRDIIVFIAEDSPRNQISTCAWTRRCHQATVQLVHKTLCIHT